ncbi:hypothetical protein HDU96_002395 [Phlyctochytrium bullatum]|nr:hypothetical protein HDU96_002395 [Phlyctochytrium bullatum]
MAAKQRENKGYWEIYNLTALPYPNPFALKPLIRGEDFILPPFETLPVLLPNNNRSLIPDNITTVGQFPPPIPGLGCFVQPFAPVGYTLGNETTGYGCAQGYFCPYVEPTVPGRQMVACPPSEECGARRLIGMLRCMPQGLFEPIPCPAGFYCPDPKTIKVCPAGYQCATGTVTPVRCQFLSSCPPGTILESHYGILVLVLLADVLLVLAVLGRRAFELRRARLPLSALLPAFLQRLLGVVSIRRHATKNDDTTDTKCPDTAVASPTGLSATSPTKASATLPAKPSANSPTKPSPAMSPTEKTEKPPAAGSDVVVTVDEVDRDAFASAPALNDATKLAPLMECFRRAFDGHSTLRMDFRFRDLGLRLANGKTVLKGVTGSIRSGRMTAIMGPSGAGKTTFMNVLMGKVRRTGGDLWINGAQAEMHAFKKIIGYVPQEDVMLRELTVRENVYHSARCRLPGTWGRKEVEACVDAVLEALGLSHVQHTEIGDEMTRGVSGGQRKRVNIGMELASTNTIAAPLSIFLDEPTSGLDSTSALDVATILRSISSLGLTIISVIHQPRVEIFNSFDDVLLIAPGGRTAYLGPVSEVQQYFEDLMGVRFDPQSNPADLLMDILSARGAMTTDEIVAAWERRAGDSGNNDEQPRPPSSSSSSSDTSSQTADAGAPAPSDATALATMRRISKQRGASFLTQTVTAFGRSITQQSRFLSALLLEFFVAMFAGFLMGFATSITIEPFFGVQRVPYQRLSGSPDEWYLALYGMLVGIAVALSGGPAGVKVFGEEKTVYWREVAAGHSAVAYYLAKTVSVIPRFAMSSAHFVTLYYLLARPAFSVGYQYVLLFLNFFGIYGMAVIVSMLVRRENAPLLAVIIGLFSAVFCGFGPTMTEATDGGYVFLYNIGVNRWAAEVQFALSLERYAGIYNVDWSVGVYGYERGRTTRNLLVMLGLGVAYRVIGFVLMVGLNRDKQR